MVLPIVFLYYFCTDQIVTELFTLYQDCHWALYFVSSIVYAYICLAVMFHWWLRWVLRKPNTPLRSGAVIELWAKFWSSKASLTLSSLGKNVSRQDIEIVFLFSPENRIWHFIQIVSIGDNLYEMSNPVFWEKNKKNRANLSFCWICPLCDIG